MDKLTTSLSVIGIVAATTIGGIPACAATNPTQVGLSSTATAMISVTIPEGLHEFAVTQSSNQAVEKFEVQTNFAGTAEIRTQSPQQKVKVTFQPISEWKRSALHVTSNAVVILSPL